MIKKTIVCTAIALSLSACNTEYHYIKDSDRPIYDSEYALEDVSDATLLVAVDFQNKEFGEKINPTNTGSKYPAKISYSQSNLLSTDQGEVIELSEMEQVRIDNLNLVEQRTVSFWIKLDKSQTGEYANILDGGHFNGRSREPFLTLNPNGEFELWRKWHGSSTEGDDEPQKILTTDVIREDKWVHVVLTGDREFTKIYLDGVLAASGDAINSASNQLSFGASLTGNHEQVASANMQLDNIKVYRGVLKQGYINTLYGEFSGARKVTLAPGSPTPSHTIENVEFDNTTLSWKLGSEFRNNEVEYTVSVSESRDMDNAFIEWKTLEKNYNIGLLQPSTQYFWRVDTFDGSTSTKGPVWNFTTTEKRDLGLPDKLNVMTYNIWHAAADADPLMGPEYLYEQIIESNTDLLLMVESYGYQKELADKLGFHMLTDSENGNLSILSRYPIIRSLGDCNFNICGARLSLPDNKQLDTYAVWLTSSNDGANISANPAYSNDDLIEMDMPRANTMTGFLDTISTLSDDNLRPVIIAGDLNTASHLDFTEETNYYNRGQVNWPTTLAFENYQYVDTLRYVHPSAKEVPCKTWTPVFKANPGQARIDMIFAKGDQLTAVDAGCLLDDSHPVFHPADHGAAITTFKINESLWESMPSLEDDFDRDNLASENFSFLEIEGDKLLTDLGFENDGANEISKLLSGGLLEMTNTSSASQRWLQHNAMPSETNGWTIEFRVQVTDEGTRPSVWQLIPRSETFDERFFIGANGIGLDSNNGASIEYPADLSSEFNVVRIAFDPYLKAARMWLNGEIIDKNIASKEGYFDALIIGNSTSNIVDGQIVIDYIRVEDKYHAP
ncbi:LamG-like jellyroll fold domain-containing protein [Photobacterium minamisatsumaniensis]|uniref:LamG-like jellyroll fold domain-containing protein n=1 Tax=Photobacterium minamisatsumaniensis TaxID=2910233 RepID=UPI003D13CF20